MDQLFLKAVELSIMACAIVPLVILMRMVFRKTPKWLNCLLWVTVGARLVIPFSIESEFSLMPDFSVINTVDKSEVNNTGYTRVDTSANNKTDSGIVNDSVHGEINQNSNVIANGSNTGNNNSVGSGSNIENNNAVGSGSNIENNSAVGSGSNIENNNSVGSGSNIENNNAVGSGSNIENSNAVGSASNIENNNITENSGNTENGSVTGNENITKHDNAYVMGTLVFNTPSQSKEDFFISVLAIVWIIGIALMFLVAIASYIKLKIRVRTSIPLYDNVRQSEQVESPFVLGIIKPRIYLPFLHEKEALPYIIQHEKAHIKRHDHLIKPLAFAILSVYWFNPVIWLAYICLCRDIELACDEKVIKKLEKEERKAYSRALVAQSVNHRIITICPLAFGEVGVKARVKNIMRYRKPAIWVIATTAIVGIVVAICMLTSPLTYKTENKYSKFDVVATIPAGIEGVAGIDSLVYMASPEREDTYFYTEAYAKALGTAYDGKYGVGPIDYFITEKGEVAVLDTDGRSLLIYKGNEKVNKTFVQVEKAQMMCNIDGQYKVYRNGKLWNFDINKYGNFVLYDDCVLEDNGQLGLPSDSEVRSILSLLNKEDTKIQVLKIDRNGDFYTLECAINKDIYPFIVEKSIRKYDSKGNELGYAIYDDSTDVDSLDTAMAAMEYNTWYDRLDGNNPPVRIDDDGNIYLMRCYENEVVVYNVTLGTADESALEERGEQIREAYIKHSEDIKAQLADKPEEGNIGDDLKDDLEDGFDESVDKEYLDVNLSEVFVTERPSFDIVLPDGAFISKKIHGQIFSKKALTWQIEREGYNPYSEYGDIADISDTSLLQTGWIELTNSKDIARNNEGYLCVENKHMTMSGYEKISENVYMCSLKVGAYELSKLVNKIVEPKYWCIVAEENMGQQVTDCNWIMLNQDCFTKDEAMAVAKSFVPSSDSGIAGNIFYVGDNFYTIEGNKFVDYTGQKELKWKNTSFTLTADEFNKAYAVECKWLETNEGIYLKDNHYLIEDAWIWIELMPNTAGDMIVRCTADGKQDERFTRYYRCNVKTGDVKLLFEGMTADVNWFGHEFSDDMSYVVLEDSEVYYKYSDIDYKYILECFGIYYYDINTGKSYEIELEGITDHEIIDIKYYLEDDNVYICVAYAANGYINVWVYRYDISTKEIAKTVHLETKQLFDAYLSYVGATDRYITIGNVEILEEEVYDMVTGERIDVSKKFGCEYMIYEDYDIRNFYVSGQNKQGENALYDKETMQPVYTTKYLYELTRHCYCSDCNTIEGDKLYLVCKENEGVWCVYSIGEAVR